jgi:AraC-like DNA-binding protein
MDKLFASLTYFGLFQGLFLLSILLLAPTYRKKVNGYLIFLIAVLTIGLLGRTLYLLEIMGPQPRLITISEFSMLLFGPSFALFVRSLISHRSLAYRDLIHFVPALIHILYLVFYFILPSDEIIGGRLESGELIRIVLVLGAIGLSVNFGYWLWSWVLLHQVRQRIKNELSHAVKSRFLSLFLMAIGVCLMMWLIIFLVTILHYELMARVIYSFVWISLTLVILFIGFYSFTDPELFSINIENVKNKYALSKLSASDILRLKAELDLIMVERRPYLNKRLLKAELSDLLGVSNPEMARLLNEGFGMNFFEFVNYYRIKEFIQLAESEKLKNLTFAAIAQEAGFNSKATFNKAFRDIMGKTPREYFS